MGQQEALQRSLSLSLAAVRNGGSTLSETHSCISLRSTVWKVRMASFPNCIAFMMSLGLLDRLSIPTRSFSFLWHSMIASFMPEVTNFG